MGEHIHPDAITNAVLGGEVDADLQNWAHEEVSALRSQVTDYRNQLDDLEPADRDDPAGPGHIADTAEVELSAAADHAVSRLKMAEQQADQSRRFQTATMVRHGIDRPVQNPDVILTCLIFCLLTVIEGLTTALFFQGGGFVAGIGEALGLGLTISGVNVLVAGLIGGGFFGRFWNYGINARHPDATMRTKRFWGRTGSVMTALCLAGLLIASGIVRATGETEHLSFTLETLGTAATDFHSLMLWIIGIAFAIIAWRKGLSAFSDSYPGYSQASEAVTQADTAFRKASDEAVHVIDAIHADAVAAIDDLADQIALEREDWIEAVHDARHHRQELLGEIDAVESGFVAFAAEELALNQMITGRRHTNGSAEPAPKARLDLTHLRQQLPAVSAQRADTSQTFSQSRREALNRLSAARKAALEAIMAAQAVPPD